MNNFDFFYVTAHSTHKRKLLAVGIPANKIQKHIEYSNRHRYPQVSYSATVSYFDVHNVGHQNARDNANGFVNDQPKLDGVNYYVGFHTAD